MLKATGCFLFLILIFVLVACNQNAIQPIQENHNDIKIFFTPGTECENNIIERINQSKKVDIAVYSITNPAITKAIISAYKHGVNVRIVTDKTQAAGKKSLVSQIRATGIPVLTNKKHKIEHNKFAVFDDVHVVSGSYNWTTNATNYNSENCLFFDQPDMEYSKRFEYLWKVYSE